MVPLTVQTRTTSTDAGTGEVSESWADVEHVWAHVEIRGGMAKGEYESGIQGTTRTVAVIDYRSDIKWSLTEKRLVERAVSSPVVYNIVEIAEPGLVRHVTELTLEEVSD